MSTDTLITTAAVPNGRGCGDRDEGVPYACCGISPFGTPIEFFVIDPVHLWPGEFQRGVKILPRNPKNPEGVKDLVVFVGKKFYQSPWSFVEEVRRFGASRRLSNIFPFDKLTPDESRMIFIHSKAIPNFDYEANRDKPCYGCDKCNCLLEDGTYDKELWPPTVPGWHSPEIDSGVVWHDPALDPCTYALRDLAFLVHGDIEPDPTNVTSNTTYQVNMPSFSYEAKYPIKPESYIPTKWKVGIFMALPLTHIEYARRPDEKSTANAKAAGFETVIMEH